MSSRNIKVSLPESYATQLDELAAASGERVATLAGQLIRYGLTEAVKDGKLPQLPPTSTGSSRASDGRAPWLEPYGGDPIWRADMWGQIVALHGRYPRHLSHLKDEWWTDDSHTETLCSLASWRAEIDDYATEPREELAFQTALLDYANLLRNEGGGVATAWEPGAPPSEWTAK